jgi:hypothetical protein
MPTSTNFERERRKYIQDARQFSKDLEKGLEDGEEPGYPIPIYCGIPIIIFLVFLSFVGLAFLA